MVLVRRLHDRRGGKGGSPVSLALTKSLEQSRMDRRVLAEGVTDWLTGYHQSTLAVAIS